jgi:hypothetical protein
MPTANYMPRTDVLAPRGATMPSRKDPADIEATASKTVIVAAMLCLWEGVPFSLIGMSNILGLQLYAIITAFGAVLYFVQLASGKRRFTYWDLGAVTLFSICVFSSFCYSVLTHPQPLAGWIFAIYSIAPVLTILALRGINCRLGDAVDALYWTGFIGSALLLVDRVLQLGLLDFYERGSAFGTDRIIFFKLESTFCVVIAAMRIIAAKRVFAAIQNCVALLVTFYCIFVLSESRLAILAALLALALTWLFVIRGSKKVFVAIVAPFALTPIALLILGKYLNKYDSLDAYLANDVSASWRLTTIKHFYRYFAVTDGLGFGFMSASKTYDNVLSFSTHFASQLYGVVDYVVSLDDIGIYSALFQYGYMGLLAIVVMTFAMCKSLFQVRNAGGDSQTVAAIGLLAVTFTFSPISMNYFTLFYTAHIGGLLWFMAAEASAFRRPAKARPASVSPASSMERKR